MKKRLPNISYILFGILISASANSFATEMLQEGQKILIPESKRVHISATQSNDKQCSIEAGGEIKIISFADDRSIATVEYIASDRSQPGGSHCPSGTPIDLYSAELLYFEEQYAKAQTRRAASSMRPVVASPEMPADQENAAPSSDRLFPSDIR